MGLWPLEARIGRVYGRDVSDWRSQCAPNLETSWSSRVIVSVNAKGTPKSWKSAGNVAVLPTK